ncbi:unnamed protein product [Ilex paraguariensis]|uniref:Uncharacterized protein n=1 Tax=Ilex paraguariensis TaxID=185542 RepID=A0ABC8RK15_9AQUA
MSTPSETINFCGLLSETNRIRRTNSLLFFALSGLFLFPLSLSTLIYPTLQSSLSQYDAVNTQILHHNPTETLILYLLYTLFVTLLSLCATSTITYTAFHGFYGTPVKFKSAIKSLVYSVPPLVITMVVSQIIVALIGMIFGILVALLYTGSQFFGFEIDYNSNYFIGLCIFLAILLGLIVIWLQVNWALASVIVVVESKWGIEPLRRSTHLMKGMKGLWLSILLLYGFPIGFFSWANSTPVILVANTVLYMYCKAFHGELALQSGDEFAPEYTSVPIDDDKVAHGV